MTTYQHVFLNLSITAEEYLKFYKGSARSVIAFSEDGRCVSFPASRLQPFVRRDGIVGRFKLIYDKKGKLIEVERHG